MTTTTMRVVPDPLVVRRQNELYDLYSQWPGDDDPDDDPEFVAQARRIMGLPPLGDEGGGLTGAARRKADAGMDWRAWNAAHPDHPRGSDGQFGDAPGLAGLTVPKLRDLARERGVAVPSKARKAEIVALLERPENQPTPPPRTKFESDEPNPADRSGADPKAVRAAARERARLIAKGEGTARLLAEVDELIGKDASDAAIGERLDERLLGPEQLFANADPTVLASLRRAHATGDRGKLRAAVTRAGRKVGVVPVGRAGERVGFDPLLHDPFGDVTPAAGAPVEVVRRGSRLTLPDGEVVDLDRARVVASLGKATAQAAPTPSTLDSLRELDAEALRDELNLRKVADLKALLSEQGLPTSGRKRDLVDRLVAHIDQHPDTARARTARYMRQFADLTRDGFDAKDRRTALVLDELVKGLGDGSVSDVDARDRLDALADEYAGSATGINLAGAKTFDRLVAHLKPEDGKVHPEGEKAPTTVAEVKDRIREAWAARPKAPGGWVSLADLRSDLADLSRDDIDAALRELARERGVRVAPFDNTRALRQDDRDAAIQIGDSPRHMIAMGRDMGTGTPVAVLKPVVEEIDETEYEQQRLAALQTRADAARSAADAIAEIDELLHKQTSQAAFRHLVQARQKRTAGLSDVEMAEILDAVGDRPRGDLTPAQDAERLRAIVDRIAAGHGLTPIGRAGEAARFDPSRHEGIGGLRIDRGSPVTVVRPGHMWNRDGEAVLLERAVVDQHVPPPTRPVTKAKPGSTIGDVAKGPTQGEVALGLADIPSMFGRNFGDHPLTGPAGIVQHRGERLPEGFASPRSDIYKGHFAQRPGLTPDESRALDLYVLSSVADPLNTSLRAGHTSHGTARTSVRAPGGGNLTVDLDEVAEHLDTAIAASELAERTNLYRGAMMRPADIGKLQPGAEFVESGYLSTTTDRLSAHEIIGWRRDKPGTRGRSPVMFQILAPKGTHGAVAHLEENEVLLGRGRRMRVVGILRPTRPGDTRVITVELLPETASSSKEPTVRNPLAVTAARRRRRGGRGGEDLERYWTKGEGLALWATNPHPWTTLRDLLLEKPEIAAKRGFAERLASTYYKIVFGIWPGQRKGRNPHGPG